MHALVLVCVSMIPHALQSCKHCDPQFGRIAFCLAFAKLLITVYALETMFAFFCLCVCRRQAVEALHARGLEFRKVCERGCDRITRVCDVKKHALLHCVQESSIIIRGSDNTPSITIHRPLQVMSHDLPLPCVIAGRGLPSCSPGVCTGSGVRPPPFQILLQQGLLPRQGELRVPASACQPLLHLMQEAASMHANYGFLNHSPMPLFLTH